MSKNTIPNEKRMTFVVSIKMIIDGRLVPFGLGKKIPSTCSVGEIYTHSREMIEKILNQSIKYRHKLQREQDLKNFLEEERVKHLLTPLEKSIEKGITQ